MPLFMFFRKTRTIISCFFGITILFIIIAVTPAGFPFKEKTATQRYSILHAHRVLRNADNTIRINEAGLYTYPQDRRFDTADKYFKAIGEKHKVSEYCQTEMFCGMQLWNYRPERNFWIPIDERPNIPGNYPALKLKSISNLNGDEATARKRYNFYLTGPDHMTIFVGIQENTKIIDWSFNKRESFKPHHWIYFLYAKDASPLEFSIDIEKPASTKETPTLNIGVAGYWIHHQKNRTRKYEKFVLSFPDYASIDDWVATYESWSF